MTTPGFSKGFIGAVTVPEGTKFRVWAPAAKSIMVVTDAGEYPLQPKATGFFSAQIPGVKAGDLYRYRKDDNQDLFPDPASRCQPQGVHGPSQVVDSTSFPWTDGAWRGVTPEQLVIYELHVGAFSPEGTFAGVRKKLPELAALGVTAVELMPLAEFPGDRNWGYDGTALFAPARCYGTPEELRRLVDAAHGLGLAVIIDVVYNHFGPDGNYTGVYSPYYTAERNHGPWGAGVNLDGEHSRPVRDFFIANAKMWIQEYHADGLRLDATHGLEDASQRHFLAELADEVRQAAAGRLIHLIAEDDRNLACMVRDTREGGWGLDAVWADDWHHQMRRCLAGDQDGYYADYSGSMADLARTIAKGWFYCGQVSNVTGRPRGSDPAGLPLRQFVYCLQNHDQVGNRARGERLHHLIEPAAYRAAIALLLFLPQTPLLFMGQEWAASSPFLYFTDHHPELGRLVTRGRREEFKSFEAFADPAEREKIPDPQARETFLRSRLIWDERREPGHAAILRYYRRWLACRRERLAVGEGAGNVRELAVSDSGLVLKRGRCMLMVQLKGSGSLAWRPTSGRMEPGGVILTSEEPAFCADPAPPEIAVAADGMAARFHRPGAVLVEFSNPEEL